MKRRLPMESTEDSSVMVLCDLLLGTVGIAIIIGAALMLNQGDPITKIEPPTDMSVIIAEITEDMAENASMAADLQGQLDESRAEVFVAKESTKNATDYYEEQRKSWEETNDANVKRWQRAEAKARDEANKLAHFRKSKRVRVIFVLDCSGSMEEMISEGRETLKMLMETLPYALTSFEVGVVCHREGSIKQQPLTRIVRRKDDNGESIDAIKQFLDPIVATSGVTRINEAVDLALDDLGKGDGEQSDVVVICADVGPGDLYGLNHAQANALRARLDGWANRSGKNRVVLSIYTPPRPESTPPDEEKHREFFESLGRVNKRSRFSTRLAAMFPLTFQSSFVQGDD